MDRPLPTDPPDEPVNRIAWALEPEVEPLPSPPRPVSSLVGKVDSELAIWMDKDLERILALYTVNPLGEHQAELLKFANRYCGGPKRAILYLNVIQRIETESSEAADHAAAIRRMIDDLTPRPADGDLQF